MVKLPMAWMPGGGFEDYPIPRSAVSPTVRLVAKLMT
jgi:hypothetical protein